MYEGVESTIQDYRHLHLVRKIHERNLVINILRFYDVFLCVVPFQIGADTGSLRGGLDVGGIGFEPRCPRQQELSPDDVEHKDIYNFGEPCHRLLLPSAGQIRMLRGEETLACLQVFFCTLATKGGAFHLHIYSTVLILPWVSTGLP